MGAALVLDRGVAAEIIRDRRERGIDKFDEVWEGVYVVSPLARLEHQFIAGILTAIFDEVVQRPGLGRVFPGANVSDREVHWDENFRCPDVVLVLNGSRARDCDTHLVGGPDFLVEILSEDDKSYDKLDFYAKIGVRELLIIDPGTRRLELFRLAKKKMALVGKSDDKNPRVLRSSVIPLSVQWTQVKSEPKIHVSRTDGKTRKWTV